MAKPNIHRLVLDYFIKHQKELCKKYKDKELLMRGAMRQQPKAADYLVRVIFPCRSVFRAKTLILLTFNRWYLHTCKLYLLYFGLDKQLEFFYICL